MTSPFFALTLTLGQEPLHESGVEFAGAEIFIREDLLVERDGGVDALHDELAQGALHLRDGFGAINAVHDQLGNERVVIGRDDAFSVLRSIDANAVAAGNIEGRDLAC